MNIVRVNNNFKNFFIFFVSSLKMLLNHIIKLKFKKNKKNVDMHIVRVLICRHTQHGGK